MVADALRGHDDATRWPAALGTPRLQTDRDDVCVAYFRSARGFDLLADRLIHTDDYLLVIANEGDLVIESAGIPFTIREGGSALIPPGRWRITDAPVAGQISYWLIFFSPSLLVEVIGDDEQSAQLAARVTPAHHGVFVQQHLLDILHAWGQPTPVDNIVQTIRAMASSMSAGFFMFLKEHFYKPRQALQSEVRLRWMDGARKLGQHWSGGTTAFQRDFRLYHGINVDQWVTRWRRQPAQRAGHQGVMR